MVEHLALYSSPPPDTMYIHTSDSTGIHVHTLSPQDKDALVQLGVHLKLQPIDLDVMAHIEEAIGTAFSAAVSVSVQQYLQQQSVTQETVSVLLTTPVSMSTLPVTTPSTTVPFTIPVPTVGTSSIASGSGGAVTHSGYMTYQSKGQGKSSQGAGADVRCAYIKHTDLASHPPDTTAAATVPTMMTPATPVPIMTPEVVDPVVTITVPAPPPIAPVAATAQCPPTVSQVAHTAHYYQQQKLWLCELDYDNIPDGIKNLLLQEL